MEFLRFGSSIPGEYWGCCAVDIIQNFKQDPDTKASIQLVSGDGGGGLTKGKEYAFLGPTLRDIFWNRLRISTFGLQDHPNKAFLAVLEESQLHNDPGRKWLALLKEAGFEFIRRLDNSVYTGSSLGGKGSPHTNYLFGLFRNIGNGYIENPFEPPKAWTDLSGGAPEIFLSDYNAGSKKDMSELADRQRQEHRKIWDEHGPTSILTESEIVAAKAPVIMAGLRTEFPPQKKETREEAMAERKKKNLPYVPMPGTQYLYTGN